MSDKIKILAIESSCDETAAAVVEDGRCVKSNIISSQIELHKLYGGVVPEIASRKHVEKVNFVVREALKEAGETLDSIDAIAVTYGPGLVGALLVGVAEAKALAFAKKKPLVGAHGAGGEIGHLCVNYEETDHCGCGNTGCLEQYASATGITRLANIRLAKDDAKSVLREQEVSAKTVFDAVKAGDAVAKEIVEEFGKYLGHAMANLAAVVDPSAIVIGGGVSKAGEVLIEYVEKNFKERAFFANKDTEFVLATLGNDAGICGAAKLILS